ncbi:MAG TPA: hypothetical protein VII73_10860 [Caulobacteraceae bacterium]
MVKLAAVSPDAGSSVDGAWQALAARSEVANPPLALRIGFSGHRAVDRLGDEAVLSANLDAAFRLARDAVGAMAAMPLDDCDEILGDAFDGPASLRLITGIATGADRIAIARWRVMAAGPVHALTPYLDPATGQPLTDEPSHAKWFDRVTDLGEFETSTCLDGAAAGRHGHGELSRWIVRNCDVVVVVWDGGSAVGAGGTGDTVRLALHKGVPVLWIRPNAPDLQLLDPSSVWRDDGATEAAGHPARLTRPATIEALSTILFAAFAPPLPRHRSLEGHASVGDPEIIARRDFARRDPLHRDGGLRSTLADLCDHTLWRAFDVFKSLAGKPPVIPRADPPAQLPADVAAQEGYRRLAAALDQADQRANRLSQAHRSQQLILLALAMLAVVIGVMAPDGSSPLMHLIAIGLELFFAVGILALWSLARRGHRHRRWSDARRLAERFRAALATYPLGIDIADEHADGAQTWTEWRARAVIRAAGVTGGVLDQDEVTARARWARTDLMDGQARYHAKEAHAGRKITERMHLWENAGFVALTAALLMGAVAAAMLSFARLPPGAMAPGLQGLVTLATTLSVIVPSMGAVALALDSTNGFSELADRSAQLVPAYEDFSARMRKAAPISAALAQEIVREAATLLVSDTDSWRDRLVRRRLIRGG